MVSRHTKKRAKYTYAERVLGALSEIQKDQRKHAVHMATLRAHVRKTADARKDKMGPQWAQWVSRTVNKLADGGILDTSDPHGNISFTPHAKKTITKVRRESLGPGVAPSPGLERRIWKDVTRRVSGAGLKRPRRMSSATQPPSLFDDDDEHDGTDARPRKRQARRSLSRMTKAELEAELRDALQRLHDAQEQQPASTEELATLQEELSDREKEVAALREELARLKERPPTEDRRVTVGTSTRLLTPPPTNPSLPSSSGRTTTSTGPRLAATHGVTRTLSGSLISNLSKRPTPEPSDADSQEGADIDELIFGDDEEDVDMSSAFPEVGVFSRPPQTHGLATPQSSPLLADQGDLGPEADGQDASEEHGGDQDPAQHEVMRLKSELEALSAELMQSREAHQRAAAERDELRGSATSHEERIRALDADIRTRDEAIALSNSRCASLEQSLKAEVAQRNESQNALSAERERTATLEGQVAELTDRCQELRGDVRFLRLHSSGLAEELKAARFDASDWRAAHRESEAQSKTIATELAGVSDRLRAAQHESQAHRDALVGVQALLAERTTEHEQAGGDLIRVQDELAKARQELETSHASQETMSVRVAELERDLEGTRAQTRALHSAKDDLERASGKWQETVEQLREELSHAKAQLASSRAEVQRLQDVIDDLRATHARAVSDASAEAATLRVTVSELELSVDELRAQLGDAAAEAAELRKSLETEQASRRGAESEVVASKADRDALLSDLTDKTARLASAAEELDQVRRAEREVRRQLEEVKERHSAELAARAAEKSAVDDALAIARAKGADLEAEVDLLSARISSLSDELASVVAEKDQLAEALHESNDRVSALQEDLEVARNDVRDAEEEIEELRSAKAEDEASIQSLKAGLAKLRQLQMDALNEVDSKMISAHTAPTPGSRRRSSIAPRLSSGTRAR